MTVGTAAGTDEDLTGDQQGGAASDPLRLSTTVAAGLPHVWEVLVSDEGSQALLGGGARLGTKGQPYTAADGSHGVVRSYHPLEQLRVSWHPEPDAPACVVELDLVDDGEGTRLELALDHLPAGRDPAEVVALWQGHLDDLGALAQR